MRRWDEATWFTVIIAAIIGPFALYELIKFGFCVTHSSDLRCLGYFSTNH